MLIQLGIIIITTDI